MPTIRQLAALAGVSIGTVSMALRDHPRISTATRARIQALAREHRYHPNRPAQSAFSGRTHTFGCVIPSLLDPFSAALAHGLLHAAHVEDYSVRILETAYQQKRTRQVIHQLVEHRVDGVLLFPGDGAPPTLESYLELASHGIRVVTVDGAIPHCDDVTADRTAGAHMIIEYVWGLGHRHLALLGSAKSRWCDVLMEAVALAGLPTPLRLDYALLQHPEVLYQFLSTSSPMCSAVVADGDGLAAVFQRMVIGHGIRVPEQLSICTTNDSLVAQATTPLMTALDACPEAIGRQCAQVLVARINDTSDAPPPPTRYTVPPRLVIRASCSKPAHWG